MNKIVQAFQLYIINMIVFLSTTLHANAQDSVLNKYGLLIIHTKAQLQKTAEKDAAKSMVNIKTAVPGILLDLRYATANNFTHRQLYSAISTTFLRKPATDALAQVQKELNKKGLGLKIFDAYRPYAATEKMWELVKDDRYAADPKTGSGHNRGISVDLTIVDLKTKKELPMGTGFDNFTDSAHHAFTALPQAVLQNRLLLKNTMERYGFKALDTEWWHYSLPNAKAFELLDIDFRDMEKPLQKKVVRL